ncbi:MAG: hypothetical protein GX369_07155 [Euryarchaeota archaeon]|nr:hypothetical protein [Euryarchaeota archaeon]
MENNGLGDIIERGVEQTAKITSEVKNLLDRAMNIAESNTRHACEEVSREAVSHFYDIKKFTQEILRDMRDDVPHIRREFRSIEYRAMRKLRKLMNK